MVTAKRSCTVNCVSKKKKSVSQDCIHFANGCIYMQMIMSLFLTLQDSLTLFKLQTNDLGNNLVYMTEGIVLAVYRQK